MRRRMSSRTVTASTMYRAPVEHHALGPHTHGGVDDLCARWLPRTSEPIEDHGCPDDRLTRGFAQPQDLVLQFGQPLVSALHGQIAARDHHPGARVAPRGHQIARQVAKPLGRLDFHVTPSRSSPRSARADFAASISSGPHTNDISTTSACSLTNRRVRAIGVGGRGDRRDRVGPLDAPARPQPRSLVAGEGDPQPDPFGIGVHHHAGDLAVVEVRGLARCAPRPLGAPEPDGSRGSRSACRPNAA